MIELACETDFVAKNEKFVALSETVLQALADSGAETVEARHSPLPPARARWVRVIEDAGRNPRREGRASPLVRLTGDKFAIYLHQHVEGPAAAGRCRLAYTGDDAETARSIAQHISFANPEYLSKDDVPAAAVDNERHIVEEITRTEGKPEAALPKIIEGRIGAYYKQVALLEQDYAKDNKLTVSKVAKDAGSPSPASPVSRSARNSTDEAPGSSASGHSFAVRSLERTRSRSR